MADSCFAKEMLGCFEPFVRYKIGEIRAIELQDMRDAPIPGSREFIISSFGTSDVQGCYQSMYGWISPDGKYYSCGHGLHEMKAQMIIRAYRDLMTGFLTMFNNANDGLDTLHSLSGEKNPSDFLSKKGWCRFQNPDFGEPEACMYHLKQLTPKQIETIYAVAFKFKLTKDPLTKKKMDWAKVPTM